MITIETLDRGSVEDLSQQDLTVLAGLAPEEVDRILEIAREHLPNESDEEIRKRIHNMMQAASEVLDFRIKQRGRYGAGTYLAPGSH